ncbi:GerMN domain-containing protein [Marinicrinis lubricantis]|uniref:GerMN domain-containing protein n=1 Tax=Marinicrinis lubricantis TaxID=2086470 RepID=A0ABW1IUJ1_9BACL
MKALKWKSAFILFLLSVVLLAGCSFGSDNEERSIDPPPAEQEDQIGESTSEDAAVIENTQPVTLYFKDEQGYVAPVTMDVPQTEGIAKQALNYMVEGGPGEGQLPEGFTALIPAGTEVLGMDIRDGLAIVDFSEYFTNYNPHDERKMLEAITWALTGFSTVDQVQIRVEGAKLAEMPMNATPLDEPLSRDMGINVERGEGVNLVKASAVTLYFQNKTEDDYTYLVPVTRMIDYTDNTAEASLNQLIQGPSADSSLASVIMPEVQVLGVKQQDQLVTVNFDSAILGAESAISTETLQSIILSVTESTGAEQVQIMVDGKVGVQSTDAVNYSAPVNKPAHVNKLEM